MAKHDPLQALSEVRREFGEHGGVSPSVARSSTFTVLDPAVMPDIFSGLRGPSKGGCFLYSRHFNPTVDVLNRYLAAMENTEAAMCTASGMAAISSTLLQLCQVGDHIVAADTLYGGTHALLNSLLPSMGIEVTFVDPTRVEDFVNAIRPNTKVFYAETLANPTLKVVDIPALASAAHARDIRLVVDNTFMPMLLSPATLGADVVVYSLTKFVNGAGDQLAGAICGSQEFIHELMDLHTGRLMLLGPTVDPRVAYDLIQRIPHLSLRMQEHSVRAQAIAEKLESWGLAVTYPGLESHTGHEALGRMLNAGAGYGGIVTLDCGTRERAEMLMAVLQNDENFGLVAVSLGYFDTLMSCPSSSTSSEIAPEDQEKVGLSRGLIRISVGLTGRIEERIEQLERSLAKLEFFEGETEDTDTAA